MKARFDPVAAAPELMKAWIGAALPIAASLEPALAELVEIRASQINGCASCIHIHSQMVKLTLMIVVINGWNRIAMGCGGFADPAAARAVATAVAGP